MTPAEMLGALEPPYREAIGAELRDVPAGVTTMEWHVSVRPSVEGIGAFPAAAVASELAQDGKGYGCKVFGHLRVVDRAEVILPVTSLITRKRAREFVVYAIGWKEEA